MCNMDKCNQTEIQTTFNLNLMNPVNVKPFLYDQATFPPVAKSYGKTRWFLVTVRRDGITVTDIPPSEYKFIENRRNYGFKAASSQSKQNVMYLMPPQLTRSEVNNLIHQIERPKSFGSNKTTCKKDKKKNFESQGLYDYISSMFSHVKNLPSTMQKAEEVVDIAHSVAKPVNDNILRPMFSASNLANKFFEEICKLCKWFLFDVVLGEGLTAYAWRLFIFKFIPYLYRFLKNEALPNNDKKFEAQSLDSLIMASLFSGVIGSRLLHLFKNISLFTRIKILDDLSFVQDCMAYILEVPFLIAIWLKHKSTNESKLFNNCHWFAEVYSQYILEKIPFTRMNRMSSKFESLFRVYNENNSILSDTKFQEGWESFYDDYSTWKDVYLTFAKNLPVKMLHISKKITDFNIRYLTYKNATRSEPLCFLFYGPPGCGKSTMLSQLVKEIGVHRTVYTHASYQDRDFYDHYNNEDVFVMDDIGQKGVYQWSDIINMVSTIRYPLNCAEATKKGTKHFSSSFLLFTSNINPANITLTADCGITDKEALCRRIKLFDFTHVTFINGVYGGTWTVKVRDTTRKEWLTLEKGEILSNESFVENIMQMFNMFSYKQRVTNSYTPNGKIGRLYIPNKDNDPFHLDEKGYLNWEANMYKPKIGLSSLCGEDLIFSTKDGEPPRSVWSTIEEELEDAAGDEFYSDSSSVPQDQSIDSVSIEDIDTLFSETNVEVTWRSEFVRLLMNMSEFICKCFSFDFLDFSDFVAHIKDLILRPVTYCFSTFLLFSTSFLYLCYFLISHYFNKTKTWVKDVTYVNTGRPKTRRSEWLPDGFTTVEEAVKSKVSTLERVDNIKGVYFFDLSGVHRELNFTHTITGIGFCTGKVAIVPHHYYQQFDPTRKLFITVKSGDGSVVVDNAQITQVFCDKSNDVVVFNMQIAYQFPKIKFGALDSPMILDNVLIGTPFGVFKTGGSFTNLGYKSQYYVDKQQYPLYAEDTVSDVSLKGLCGAIYYCKVDNCIAPIGMHVAGSIDGKLGICKKFSSGLIEFLNSMKNNATCIVGGVPGMSIAKTDVKLYQNVPDKSALVDSSVSGIFPKDRKPANLKIPVKEISKKSHSITKTIDIEALDYAETFIESLIPNFDKCVEKQVVNGIKIDNIEVAHPINKDTSCGFGYPLKKEDYLDYERGLLKPVLRNRVENLRSQLAQGSVQVSDAIHAEILKDELRNVEKIDKPRSFKMAPLHVTCLQREYMLDLLVKLHSKRDANGVRVCINPFSDEWIELMRKHQAYGHSFDGDWGKWDGGMLPQFQSVLRSVLIKKFCGSKTDKVILDNLLLIIQNCPTITLDDVYYTTHSLPSGIALTAEYNSLINKMLTAYIYYILHKQQFGFSPTLAKFMASVRDDVYGDDKLVSTNAETAKWFNGKTFESVANVLGLDFTPASKGAWTYTTQSIEKCTFLKRGFLFNDFLQTIAAPLDMKTITSTLNYVKDASRCDELTTVKLLNFQRELFLHGSEVYYTYMQLVNTYLANIDFEIQFLSVDALVKLYRKGELFESICMA